MQGFVKVVHNYNVDTFQILLMTTSTSYSIAILIWWCYVNLLYNYFIILLWVMCVEVIIKHACVSVCVCICFCPYVIFIISVKHDFLYIHVRIISSLSGSDKSLEKEGEFWEVMCVSSSSGYGKFLEKEWEFWEIMYIWFLSEMEHSLAICLWLFLWLVLWL